MEKLIELLNEYDGTPTEWKQIGDKIYFDGLGGNSELHELIIISKYYGFIKRLVGNNRIDTQNLITYINGTSLTFNKVPSTDCAGIEKTWNKFYTECLLMLLSIQDNPIEFLISILK